MDKQNESDPAWVSFIAFSEDIAHRMKEVHGVSPSEARALIMERLKEVATVYTVSAECIAYLLTQKDKDMFAEFVGTMVDGMVWDSDVQCH